MIVRRFVLAAAMVFVASFALSHGTRDAVAASDAPAIRVNYCVVASHNNLVWKNKLINAALVVNFRNEGSTSYRRLVWRARYGSGWIEFNDVGRFSPGVDILNPLRIINEPKSLFGGPRFPFSEYENLGEPGDCHVVMAEAMDGTTWSQRVNEPAFNIPSAPPVKPPPDFASSARYEAPVAVLSCEVEPVLFAMHKALVSVRYMNVESKPIAQTVFRVAYGASALDVVDKADAPTRVLIRHQLHVVMPFATNYQTLDEATNCAIVSVSYADGSAWKNPTLDATAPPLPSPPPDVNFDYVGLRWRDGRMPNASVP